MAYTVQGGKTKTGHLETKVKHGKKGVEKIDVD